jgi:hypothetical protein
LSAPPQALAMPSPSFVVRTPSTLCVFGSLVQTCVAGSAPLVLASSHFCNAFARFWTYVAACFAIASLHFTASADASRAAAIISASAMAM